VLFSRHTKGSIIISLLPFAISNETSERHEWGTKNKYNGERATFFFCFQIAELFREVVWLR
jgi:hypothetical protein